MPNRYRPAAAVCALLVILFFHLAVAWQDFATISSNGFLYDDSFYAFKIAQSIAAGQGMTFDGVHPTTGFQPLYVFLLVPAFMASGGDPVLPIYIALSILALFTTLTTWLVYRIARRYVGFAASAAAAAIWTLSPVVIRQSANGLETAVAAFMIALAACYYLENVRPLIEPKPARFAVLGILLGLVVVSRIDGIFLVMAVTLDYLILMRKRRVAGAAVVKLLLLPLGVLLFYGPWLFYNVVESGSPLQDSGAATRFLSLAYASYFDYGPDNLAGSGPNASFIWGHVVHSVSVMKVIPAAHVVFRAIDKAGAFLGAGGAFHAAGNVLGFLALFGLGLRVRGWRREPGKSNRSELYFLVLFSGLLLAAYSLYIFGAFFFLRYYFPVYFAAAILSALLLQDLFDWYHKRSLFARRALVAAGAVYVIVFACFSWSQSFRTRPVYSYYDLAGWIDANTREDETIGIFQCGTIGYLSNRRIINLDGKVNRDAFEALKTGCIEEYLQSEKIDVVVDHAKILRIFLGITPEKMRSSCTQIVPEYMKPPSGWVAFRRSGEEIGNISGRAALGRAAAILPPASR